MNKNSGMINDLCEISAILSHKYTEQLSIKLNFGYRQAISVIIDTSVKVYKSIEAELNKTDDLHELYNTFSTSSFQELVTYLGGKHIREQLGIEVTDESIK